MGAVLQLNPEKFINDKNMRSKYISKTDVLDQFEKIIMLPDDTYIESKEVARYYDAEIITIRQARIRHEDEFIEDGVITLTGEEFKSYKQKIALHGVTLLAKSSVTLFTRKAVLRMGMLLTKSDVAKKIRDYLLSTEDVSSELEESNNGKWSMQEIILLHETMKHNVENGNSKMGAIRAAAKALKRNANNVQWKYFKLCRDFGSLEAYLDSQKEEQEKIEVVATAKKSVEVTQDASQFTNTDIGLILQLTDLKIQVADMKNQLMISEMKSKELDSQLASKNKLINKLKREKNEMETKLKTIIKVIHGTVKSDLLTSESNERNSYIVKDGIVEVKK